MNFDVWKGLLIPFLGTTLGAGCVFFMRAGRCNVRLRDLPLV